MRTKSMVTSQGRANGRGFTRGVRVVTGVMVFSQGDRSPFSILSDNHIKKKIAPYGLASNPDELPPFDLLLAYVGEDGDASYRTVRGVEIVQGQGTDSVDDVNPNESYSFVALDISGLTPLKHSQNRWGDNLTPEPPFPPFPKPTPNRPKPPV